MSIEVVFADEAIVVLNKPSGLLCVPGRGADKQDSLSLRVQNRFADALVVHRLDMSTSGLLVMARGIANQRLLSEAFASRTVHKRYEALVHGAVAPTPPQGRCVSLPIIVDWPNRPLRIVDALRGKPSETRVHLLGQQWHPNTATDTSRVSLEPLTGRSHQLRVHLLAIGHPILGDALYAPAAVAAMAPRLLLHACKLAFQHPATGKPVEFLCPCDF